DERANRHPLGVTARARDEPGERYIAQQQERSQANAERDQPEREADEPVRRLLLRDAPRYERCVHAASCCVPCGSDEPLSINRLPRSHTSPTTARMIAHWAGVRPASGPGLSVSPTSASLDNVVLSAASHSSSQTKGVDGPG